MKNTDKRTGIRRLSITVKARRTKKPNSQSFLNFFEKTIIHEKLDSLPNKRKLKTYISYLATLFYAFY